MGGIQSAYGLLEWLRGSPLHPQWIADRSHARSRKTMLRLKNATIVDIGCGASVHPGLASPSNQVIRLDYPSTGIRYPARPDVFGNAQQLPFAERCADAALLLEVAEHLPKPQQALVEIARIVKPGGSLYFSAPFVYPLHDRPHDYHRFTRFGILQLLTANGFEIQELVEHGNPLTAALQLLNLALLEAVRDMAEHSFFASALLALMSYPITLLINLLAMPLSALPWQGGTCLGYFIHARRRPTAEST
ncbi:MAG: class I SAM-dependent methyltransferase [Candidatus Thiodiazotropha sp. (ex Epidulcina cf. delphinae)]|nr:class I SAM-dependent methyltransferase [Candidatus Thiodiazotropha sp. (ex Epidulcina cf. delphinae)]